MINIFSPLEKGLGDWITDSVRVDTLEEADIVMLPGGSDIHPFYYYHSPIDGCYYNSKADIRELELWQSAVTANKFIVGVCKGAQWLTIAASGWLIQDVDGHHGHHEIETYDGKTFTVNSSHHQMCYPYDLKEDEDYQLLGWSDSISSKYIVQDNQDISNKFETGLGFFKEPEVIYYPKIRGLAVQAHPEWTSMPADFNEWLNELITKLI